MRCHATRRGIFRPSRFLTPAATALASLRGETFELESYPKRRDDREGADFGGVFSTIQKTKY